MESMTFQQLTDELTSRYLQGKYAEALELVQQNSDLFPQERSRTTFWRMCLLSLGGRVEDVLSLFHQSLDEGLWWAESQFADPDLNNVRGLPEFQRLARRSQAACEQARQHVQRDYSLLVPERPASGAFPLLIALHGRGGNKDSNLDAWEVARRRGWLVLSPQSTQPIYSGAYCWDDAEAGLADLLYSLEQVSQKYSLDMPRLLVAGFSQGSGMAIHTALSQRIKVCGFIGIASYWDNPASFAFPADEEQTLRGYFVVGGKDQTLENSKEIRKALAERRVPYAEEIHPDLGHEFPPDFEKTFDHAIDFIFKEHE